MSRVVFAKVKAPVKLVADEEPLYAVNDPSKVDGVVNTFNAAKATRAGLSRNKKMSDPKVRPKPCHKMSKSSQGEGTSHLPNTKTS